MRELKTKYVGIVVQVEEGWWEGFPDRGDAYWIVADNGSEEYFGCEMPSEEAIERFMMRERELEPWRC